ncbi:hypothetical protein L3X38_041941 [Prunus dulcis]|uniref:Uncharacterized protein n=1 Tax=Prunus dulcis TaxID=3755 RepID=A0AAD4UVW4_PRUDU|nr:hypothetical protein L3X38_041941 [Prunus dulcis]
MDKLSRSRLMIQDFNQRRQRAMGMIRIELVIGDLKSSTLFHVIDAKTSYHLLLRRPWAIPRKDEQSKCIFAEENSDKKPKSTTFGQIGSPPINSQKVSIPVLHYVSSSQRKEGQSPFGEEVKPRKLAKSGMKFLKESTTMHLPKLSNSDMSKSSVPGFVRPLRDATRCEYLPVKRTKEGFDPNAYKVMSKAGYDFGLSSSLGELNPDVTGERTHGLSETQKKLKEQGYTIDSPRTGLGFTHVALVKISARRKEKKAEAQHISVEVVEEEEEPKAIKRASVCSRGYLDIRIKGEFNQLCADQH